MNEIILSLGLGFSSLSSEERASRAFDNAQNISADDRLKVLNAYFVEPLAPVGTKAQRKVPVPAGLNLDEPYNAQEAAFLESGGDVVGHGSDGDDLEVSFVQNPHNARENDSGYMNIKG